MNSLPSSNSYIKALAIVWLGHFIVDLMIGFWSVYKTLAHFDLAIAGLIAGICPFIGEGMQIYFGNLGDKGHRKALLIFGVGAASAAAFLTLTDQYFLVFLVYLLTCIGSGAFHPTAVAIASSLTKHRKGLYVTIFATGGALGLAVSHLVFNFFYQNYNGNTFVLLVLPLLLIAFLLSGRVQGALHVPAAQGRRYGFSAMRKLFANRQLMLLYASQVCIQSIFWGTIFLLPDVLSAKGYDSWISFGGGHFFFIIGGALMMVPGGYLSDIYAPKHVLMTAMAIAVAVFYTVLMTPLLPNALLLVLLLILGSCLGLSNPVAVAYGNRIMPSRPGLVSAFLMGMVWCIAESVGPGGGGLLTKCFTEDAAVKALSIFGVLFISGFAIASKLPAEVTEEPEFA